jgi:hypothetical protein
MVRAANCGCASLGYCRCSARGRSCTETWWRSGAGDQAPEIQMVRDAGDGDGNGDGDGDGDGNT